MDMDFPRTELRFTWRSPRFDTQDMQDLSHFGHHLGILFDGFRDHIYHIYDIL